MNKKAFISVFTKNGIEHFAQALIDLGWEIVSTGGTAKYLREKGILVTDLTDIVGEPIFGHRVVSLSREFYAMVLARQDNTEDMAELAKLGLTPISLVCCDMYPLQDEIMRIGSTLETIIEKTDIGGPTMLRAIAKAKGITVADIEDRMKVITWLKDGMPDAETFKRKLAAKAEYIVAQYCMASAEYLSEGQYKAIFGELVEECCYGENKYQKGARVYETRKGPYSPSSFKISNDTQLSYNNYCDRDRSLHTLTQFAAGYDYNFNERVGYTALAVKHGNVCGGAVAESSIEALVKMIEGDIRAIHGACIITNFTIGEAEAETILHHLTKEGTRRLIDAITAPKFTDTAIDILARKKGKCRLVTNENLFNPGFTSPDNNERIRFIRDGFLVQPAYSFVPDFEDEEIFSIKGDYDVISNAETLTNLILGWAIGSTSNSNTITITGNRKLLGNGVGQQDRVGAAELAINRADDAMRQINILREDPVVAQVDFSGAVAYSDSFFPFPDGPETLIAEGIKIIFTTTGSQNDQLTFDLCEKENVTLVLVSDNNGRGFFGH